MDSYLIRIDGEVAGYGSVAGLHGKPKDVVKEFYLDPARRGAALDAFRRLVAIAGAKAVEAQTNDVLLTLMLLDCANSITRDKVLFHDAFTTHLPADGITFREVTDADRPRMFQHTGEPAGDWLLEREGQIVATGGLMFHYNPPYGDIYMEVAAPFRRQGYGSYLVQELKRTCREMGKMPAARCQAGNVASRAALQKAGMLPCARILIGELR